MNVDYTRQYANWHVDTESHHKRQAKGYDLYLALLALKAESKILDVGCGRGYFVRAALDYGLQNVIGIDSSQQQIDFAKKYDLPCQHVEDSNEWLSRNTSEFDAIFLFDVLEHIPVEGQIQFLKSLRNALKPGGSLFLRVPNASSTFAARYRWIDWTHYCSFTEYSLDFVLYNSGFLDISVMQDSLSKIPIWFPRPSVRGLLRPLYYGFRRLQAIAEFGTNEGLRIPLTTNILARCQNTRTEAHSG